MRGKERSRGTTVRYNNSTRLTPHASLLTKFSWRALTPALVTIRCGCFLPDLTRFTGLPCGEARRAYSTLLVAQRGFAPVH